MLVLNPAIDKIKKTKDIALLRKKVCSAFRKKFYPLFDFKQRHNVTFGKKEKKRKREGRKNSLSLLLYQRLRQRVILPILRC
mgnify:CR=1 FL=1